MTSSERSLVSIVIPCYNQGRFLAEAIDSALQQTYPAIEVIVVDDGSTDATASVARQYATIRFLQQPNQGTAAARNAGLRESRGEYLMFLDADDRLLADAVATGMEWLAAHPDWAFVTGHVRLMNQDGVPGAVPPQPHMESHPYLELLQSNYIWTPGVVMYRRTVFATIPPFQPSATGSADYELNIRVARQFAVGCHHQVILEYRQHAANMSADVGLMLQSAVSVRRRQRRFVRGDPAAWEAWQHGIERVQADFGRRLVDQVKRDCYTRGRRRRALHGLWRLARYYPQGLTSVFSGGVRRLTSGR